MRHQDARRLLIGGLALMLLAMLANVLLGGTGGAAWIGLTVVGFVACAAAIVHFILNPIRRTP